MAKKDKKGRGKTKSHSLGQIGFWFAAISLMGILPFIHSKATHDPVLSPRLLFLAVFVLMATLFSLGRAWRGVTIFRLRHQPFYAAWLVYLMIGIVSLFFAINPAEGLFDLVRTFLTLFLVVILVGIFNNMEDPAGPLARIASVIGLIMAAIGIFEYFNYAYGKPENELYDALYEIRGLMAHKNQFAIQLFLLLPFTVFGTIRLRGLWKLLCATSLILLLLTIFVMQTRSVWIATAVSAIISTAGYVVYLREQVNAKPGRRSRSIALLVVFLVTLLIGSYLYTSPGTREVIGYKLRSLYDLDSESNRGRLEMGAATWEMIRDNPIKGVGAGNWKIHYPVFYAGYQGLEYENWRRPHNDFLWVAAEKGIFGLLAFLSIFISIMAYALGILRNYRLSFHDRLYALLFLSAMMGYLVLSNFSFPLERVGTQVFIGIMMASVLSNHQRSFPRDSKHLRGRSAGKMILAVLPLVLFSCYFALSSVRSDIVAYRLHMAYLSKDNRMLVPLAQKAFSPMHTLNQLSNPYQFYSGLGWHAQSDNVKALEDFRKARTFHPFHYNVLNNLAALEAGMKNYDLAIVTFREGLALFPFDNTARHNLALALYRTGRYEDAYIEILRIRDDGGNRTRAATMGLIKQELDPGQAN